VSLIELLQRSFAALPPVWRRGVKALRRSLVRAARSLVWWLRDLRVPVHRIEREGLRVEFIGRESVDPYVCRLLFGEVLDPAPSGSILRWRLPAYLRRAGRGTDLVYLSVAPGHCWGKLASMTLDIPSFVIQTLAAPAPGQDPREVLKNQSNKNDLNKVRREGFTYEVRRDGAALERFYRDFYKPFTRSRHGDVAQLLSFSMFRSEAEGGELLLVKRGEQPIAGVVSQLRSSVYHNLHNGVLHADPALFVSGALAAQYYFSIVEASRRGCVRVDLGYSRPFLNNGVLMYKKKWNTVVERDPTLRRHLLLRVCRWGAGSSARLQAQPFLVQIGGRFASLIFLGDRINLDDAALRSALKKYSYPGVAAMYVVLLDASWARRADTIREIAPAVPSPVHIIDMAEVTDTTSWSDVLQARIGSVGP
jgi:hypothetical protein